MKHIVLFKNFQIKRQWTLTRKDADIEENYSTGRGGQKFHNINYFHFKWVGKKPYSNTDLLENWDGKKQIFGSREKVSLLERILILSIVQE